MSTTLNQLFTDISNELRIKLGTSEQIKGIDIPQKISEIQHGGQYSNWEWNYTNFALLDLFPRVNTEITKLEIIV